MNKLVIITSLLVLILLTACQEEKITGLIVDTAVPWFISEDEAQADLAIVLFAWSPSTLVVGEAIQTILRREGFPKPYEKLKELTRINETIDKKAIKEFINTLKIPAKVKKELLQITPHNYTGKTI